MSTAYVLILLFNFASVAVFNKEDDIGTYTIKAVDDPRTLNKILYIRPPANTLSFNDVVALWEKKIGKTLEKVYVPEDQVLKNIEGKRNLLNFIAVRGIYLLSETSQDYNFLFFYQNTPL